jgi:pimeloyl-ACP methyl ester carboxylesterase
MNSRRAAVVAIAAVGLVAAAPAAARAACPRGAQCGAVTVPLDHSGAVAGTLQVAYAKVPATGTRVGTLMFLSGGPGQAALPLTSSIVSLLEPVRSSYDIVLVDQRGTGESGAVSCSVRSAKGVEVCADELGPRRALWSTAETAMDLEDVRRALAVDRLTLFGVSYGAKVAGEYARRYPASTAALVLDSPAPVDGLDGYDQLRRLGTPRVLKEVCYPGPCSATVGDPDVALRRAAARLRKGAVRGTAVSARGRVRSERVTESALYSAVAASDLSPRLRAGLPAAIASLARGDAAPLLHLAALEGDAGDAGDVNEARLLATSCLEGRLPWASDSPVASREAALKAFAADRSFAPFSAETVLLSSPTALCATWPATPAPPSVPYMGPDVPVLILSGRADLRTPLEDARRTAAQYPRSVVLAVPGVGHSVLSSDVSGCALRGMVAFLRGSAVAKCSKTSRLARLQNLSAPYAPATLAALRPTGAPGIAGRVFSAVRLTLAGVSYDTASVIGPVTLPGLRAGTVRVGKSTLTLRGAEWIRGVRVSGTIKQRGASTLTVTGPAPGTLTYSRGRVTGTLGGTAIRTSAG